MIISSATQLLAVSAAKVSEVCIPMKYLKKKKKSCKGPERVLKGVLQESSTAKNRKRSIETSSRKNLSRIFSLNKKKKTTLNHETKMIFKNFFIQFISVVY